MRILIENKKSKEMYLQQIITSNIKTSVQYIKQYNPYLIKHNTEFKILTILQL